MSKWEKSEIEVPVFSPSGDARIKKYLGISNTVFGVFRDEQKDVAGTWNLTHLKTGFGVCNTQTRAQAKTIGDYLTANYEREFARIEIIGHIPLLRGLDDALKNDATFQSLAKKAQKIGAVTKQ